MIFLKILKNRVQIKKVFQDMITDFLSNEKLNPIVNELVIRGRKLNISLAFITESYFAVPRRIRLNSTYYILTLKTL